MVNGNACLPVRVERSLHGVGIFGCELQVAAGGMLVLQYLITPAFFVRDSLWTPSPGRSRAAGTCAMSLTTGASPRDRDRTMFAQKFTTNTLPLGFERSVFSCSAVTVSTFTGSLSIIFVSAT